MRRTRSARAVGVVLFLALAALVARAEYPQRTVRIIVPYMPGGMADLQARALAEELARRWKRGVVVENRPGASGTIGAAVAANATDGHTLYLAGPAHAITATLYPDLPYDPVRSFEPVAQVGTSPFVLVVSAESGVKSVAELVAKGDRGPDGLTYATAGHGTAPGLIGELIGQERKVFMRHIPFKSAPEAVNAILSGETDFAISDASVIPLVLAGRVRALAVTSKERSAQLPGVPTMKEAGLPGCDFSYHSGILVAAGTPPEVVAELNAAIREALESPRLRRRLAAVGLEVTPSTAAEYRVALAREIEKYARTIRKAGIRPGV